MKINSCTKIVGKKIVLVPYKKIHVEKYHSWMQSPELLELTASEPLSLEQEYEMQNSWFEDDDKCTFIVLDKEVLKETEDEVESMIGDVNLYLNDPDNANGAEIEIMIADPSHRSKGKGKEALLLMLHYGIETLLITKFVAKIKMKNEISLKLFKNIGFIENNKSEVFQEIELVCKISRKYTEELKQRICMYKIEKYN
ncbi:n-acetyltransferase 9-like protein [Trichonephila inaurata madagascariensis]|uniref:N-acetyltransferase 9-like protein n=1 Tax=Trichonephila inaurata madagascariensis TaxID=2747483 RepID=A0A8X7CGY6_9ARAC|nr:n-acetyltransferase 9-like protein [Trichonephila inaurata madagascariensis]